MPKKRTTEMSLFAEPLPHAEVVRIETHRIRPPSSRNLLPTVKNNGVLQAVILRPLKDDPDGYDFEVVFGARRVSSAYAYKCEDVPAKIGEYEEYQNAGLRLIENNDRSQNLITEVRSYRLLKEEQHYSFSDFQLVCGMKPETIKQYERLLALPENMLELLDAGRGIRENMAVLIANLPDLYRQSACDAVFQMLEKHAEKEINAERKHLELYERRRAENPKARFTPRTPKAEPFYTSKMLDVVRRARDIQTGTFLSRLPGLGETEAAAAPSTGGTGPAAHTAQPKNDLVALLPEELEQVTLRALTEQVLQLAWSRKVDLGLLIAELQARQAPASTPVQDAAAQPVAQPVAQAPIQITDLAPATPVPEVEVEVVAALTPGTPAVAVKMRPGMQRAPGAKQVTPESTPGRSEQTVTGHRS